MSEELKKEEVVEEEKTEEDEFDAAFADANADKPQTPVVEESDEEEGETKEDPEEGTTKEDPLSTESTEPKVDETPEEKSERERLLEERLAKAEAKMSTWEGRITAANERAKKAEEEAEKLRKAKESKKEDLPNEEEDAVIKEFMDEFPDLHKPIVALVRRELLPIVNQLIDERIGKIEPQVTSIKQKIETDSTAAHFAAIEKAHPGWRKQIVESGELDKWIDSKSSYLRDALLKVKAQGDTDEVIDMFNQYKEETGKVSNQNTNPSNTGKSDKAKDLLAVPSSPSEPSTRKTKKDKDDFDGGWDEAMKDEK